jgi:hypothetical protein
MLPSSRRYASHDPRWRARILGWLGYYRLRNRFGPQPDDAMVGRRVTLTEQRTGWPPVGSVGQVCGYEGAIYRLRFPPLDADGERVEVWTTLPANGIDLAD